MDRNQKAKYDHNQKQQRIQEFKQAGANMQDGAGRKLAVGQIVDVPMNGMFRGHIVHAAESVLAQPGRQPQPPHVIVEIHTPRFVSDALGTVAAIYVIAEPEPEVKPVEDPPTGPSLVKLTD